MSRFGEIVVSYVPPAFSLQVCIYCYGQTSNISCTISSNLNVFVIVLPLALPNPLKSGVKSSMKI